MLATVTGFLGYLPLLTIHAGNDPDNYLHPVIAAVTLIFGTGIIRALRSGSRGRQAVAA